MVDTGPPIVATNAGVALLGDGFLPLPTGRELLEHWLSVLPIGEKTVLELVSAKFPHSLGRDEISDATDYARSSRDAYVQRLKAKKLITSNGGMITASDHLF